MRANFVLLLAVLCCHAYAAYPSRPDGRALADNEKYQLVRELLPMMREILAGDRYVEEKRNQEIMTAFNNMKELKDILRSG